MSEKKRSRIAVFAIFPDVPTAEKAVDVLKLENFRNSDISVLMPDGRSQSNTGQLAHEKSTKAPEGAVVGGASGIVLGGALGWLLGAGTLLIPGAGIFVAAGPIIALLSGAGLGGAVGGLAGSVIGMGIPEYEAKKYADSIAKGGILLAVHVDDSSWEEKATRLLKEFGGRHISTATEKVTASAEDDEDKFDDPMGRATESDSITTMSPGILTPPI